MKKIVLLLSFVAVTAVMTSCQKELEDSHPSNLVKVSFKAGTVPSKTDISSTGEVTWKDTDHLAIFTDVDGSTAYDFNVSSLNEAKTVAEFDGSVPSNPSRTAAYALYPYRDSYTGGPNATVIGINSQQTSGMNYTFMAGKGNVSGDDFTSASMSMKHLNWIYDVNITNPSAKSIKAVHFSAGSGVFTWNGTVDLTADDPVVTPSTTRKTMTVVFNTARTTDVTARFTLFPLSCTDVDFNIHVEFEDGFYETFAMGTKSLNVAAGVRKSNTFVLGNGTPSQAPWGWYYLASGGKVNDGTVISNAKAVAGGNGKDVKLYLEPGGTFSSTSRINPTSSFMIDSDPSNKPTLTQSAVTLFEPTTDAHIETLSVKNVNLVASNSLSESYVFYISNSGYTGITVGSIVFDNCTFKDYKNAFIRTVSGISGGFSIGSITMNNCIYKVKSSYSGNYAFLHLPDNAGKVDAITLTNNTFEGVGCFLYFNMSSGNQVNPFVLTFENNTIANTKQCSNAYYVNIQNAISGTTSVQNNLFVGSNANTAANRIMAEGKPENFTNTFSNNWYTSDWMTFTIDTSKTTYMNFLTDESSMNNSALCPGYASGNFTLSASDVKSAGAGDPRWL